MTAAFEIVDMVKGRVRVRGALALCARLAARMNRLNVRQRGPFGAGRYLVVEG